MNNRQGALVTIDGKVGWFNTYEDLLVHLLKERSKGKRAKVTEVDGSFKYSY